MAHVVLGVSGASGMVLAKRTLYWLTTLGHTVDLVFSRPALLTAAEELGKEYGRPGRWLDDLVDAELVQLYSSGDFTAPFASGSNKRDGMVIVPCSMGTVAAIRAGLADNLLRRAADVMVKEKRPLILVPRETPLSEIHLENMLGLAKMGVRIVPPMPAWYLQPRSLEEVEDAIVGRVFDALGLPADFCMRWREEPV